MMQLFSVGIAAVVITLVSANHDGATRWACGITGPPFENRFGAPLHANEPNTELLTAHCLEQAALLNSKFNTDNFICKSEDQYDNYLFSKNCNEDSTTLGKHVSAYSSANGGANSKIHFGCMPITLNKMNSANEPMWRYYGELPITILDCKQSKLDSLDGMLAA
eukprot:m.121475 g.121475  ORF g.121475 m.121475 type:complete len:164 (-) comp28858_c2_seq1:137-628(-)